MIKRIRQNVVQLGWLNAAWYMLARLIALLGCRLLRYQFVVQPVATSAMRAARNGAIRVSPISALEEVPCSYPRPLAVLAQRFRQGGHSIAAWRGDELAGFLWYQFGAYQEDEVRARYCLRSPYSAWDYDVFVQPHLRLGPTFCRLWDDANKRLHARGIRWTCSRISSFNPDSLRAHRRLGTLHFGHATFICCGAWQWMFASLAPYFHLSRCDGSIPHLIFDTSKLDNGVGQCVSART